MSLLSDRFSDAAPDTGSKLYVPPDKAHTITLKTGQMVFVTLHTRRRKDGSTTNILGHEVASNKAEAVGAIYAKAEAEGEALVGKVLAYGLHGETDVIYMTREE